jgi:hypothetical protein
MSDLGIVNIWTAVSMASRAFLASSRALTLRGASLLSLKDFLQFVHFRIHPLTIMGFDLIRINSSKNCPDSQRWILLRIWFSFQRACGLFNSMENRRRAGGQTVQLLAGKGGRILQHAEVFLNCIRVSAF